MFRTRKSYRVLGLAAAVMAALLILAACGGGGGTDPEATTEPEATTAPADDTPAPAVATPTAATSGETEEESTTTAADTSMPTGEAGTVSVALEGAQLPEPFVGGEEVAGTEEILEMMAMGGSGQTGTTRLVQVERTAVIEITLSPAGDGNQIAVIGRGRCDDEERSEQVDYVLYDVEDGKSISVVNQPVAYFSFSRSIILVYNGDSIDSGEAACGDIRSAFS
jgi:hypothetical protein